MRPNGALSYTRGEQEGALERRPIALESAALHDGRGAGYGGVLEETGIGGRLLHQGKASERSDYAPQGPGLGAKDLRAWIQDGAARPGRRLRFDSPPPAWKECCLHGTLLLQY